MCHTETWPSWSDMTECNIDRKKENNPIHVFEPYNEKTCPQGVRPGKT